MGPGRDGFPPGIQRDALATTSTTIATPPSTITSTTIATLLAHHSPIATPSTITSTTIATPPSTITSTTIATPPSTITHPQ
ncbi:hypothetical protein NHX12_010148 [Muraenolepis orangiensis]|uniref:Uncharacterized protein n=1 Tax=Muraenolepis orangiensis TaxID=630683 RepID=A0A9Q0I923_9TELE|nr:hypothetical protein NHX12_010148 [Muraenolepis orangiensis]